jgi:hypothetical protein
MYMRKCPTKCSGSNSIRQHDLTTGQLAKLSLSAQQAIELSSAQASRCSYCGCVYLFELAGSKRLGTLNGITGLGWVSSGYP